MSWSQRGCLRPALLTPLQKGMVTEVRKPSLSPSGFQDFLVLSRSLLGPLCQLPDERLGHCKSLRGPSLTIDRAAQLPAGTNSGEEMDFSQEQCGERLWRPLPKTRALSRGAGRGPAWESTHDTGQTEATAESPENGTSCDESLAERVPIGQLSAGERPRALREVRAGEGREPP